MFVQAFTFPLNDSGFLILLHSSHFLRYDGKIWKFWQDIGCQMYSYISCLGELVLCQSHAFVCCAYIFVTDTESTSAEALQGLFVFPDSRVVRRGDYSNCFKFLSRNFLNLYIVVSINTNSCRTTILTEITKAFALLQRSAPHIQWSLFTNLIQIWDNLNHTSFSVFNLLVVTRSKRVFCLQKNFLLDLVATKRLKQQAHWLTIIHSSFHKGS